MRYLGYICLLLLFLSAGSVMAQEGGGGISFSGSSAQSTRLKDVRILTLHDAWMVSDSLEITSDRAERHQSVSGDRDEIFLFGNVTAVEQETRITGDRGHYDHLLRRAKVEGDVRILDGETEITCREALYLRDLQQIYLTGDVVVIQPESRVEAERIVYHRQTGFIEAFGKVALISLSDDSVMRGEHGTWDPDLQLAVMDESPLLIKVESPGDTLRVRAVTMIQNHLDSTAIAVGDVSYLRGETRAYCDSAIYHQSGSRLRMMRNPKVFQDGSVLQGDVLELHFDGEELVAMEIFGSAQYRDKPADPRVFPEMSSEIAGESFRIDFEDGDIRQLEVSRGARSIYIPAVPEAGRASINEAQGDSMYFRFDQEGLNEVHIFGAASGTYRYLDNWREALGYTESDSVPLAGGFSEVAEEIHYMARDIFYEAKKERVYLEGDARVENVDFSLEARSMRFDAEDGYLDARGEPVLIESDDRLFGELMEYNIEGGEGLVHDGATRHGEGFFTGERLKKIGKETLNVLHSQYTTCDLAEPHYHFKIGRMKIKTKDKIVGAPVMVYLGRVPILPIPYIFNNLDRNRRSGFLQPDFEFGITLNNDHRPQRFIRDIGYYWAISEYMDLLGEMDFVENRSLFGAFKFQYYRRYFLNGSIRNYLTYSVKRDLRDDVLSWGLQGSHVQNIGKHTKINARIDFASSESLREVDNFTVEQTVNQRLNSTFGFSRKWDKLSLNTSYTRTQILNKEDDDPETDNLLIDEKIPISFSTISIPLWPGGVGRGGISGLLSKVKLKPKLSYNRSLKTYETHRDINETASTGSSMGFNWKLGILNVRPSVSVSENWRRSNVPASELVYLPFGKEDNPLGGVPINVLGETADLSQEQIDTLEGSVWSHKWSASSSVSTKFYGLFYPDIGDLSGIRHTIAPSVSWRYSESRGSRFALSRSLSFSLDNVLDLKFGEGDQIRRRSGLLNLSMRTGYDLTKKPDEKPWSSLSSSLRFSPLNAFSLQMSYSHDLNTGKKLSSTLSSSLSMSGSFSYGEGRRQERVHNIVKDREGGLPPVVDDPLADEFDGEFGDDGNFDPLAPLSENGDVWGGGRAEPGKGEGQRQTWNLGLSFSLNRTQASRPSPSVSFRTGVTLTENWKLDYRSSLRMDDGELTTQSLGITRDLHCWEATFSRLVFQGREQYYFRIFLKAHPDDIKIESGDRSAGYGSF